MPCYTAWNEHLDEGSPDYERTRAELEAKLRSVKHVVDYYYRAFRVRLPKARLIDDEQGLEAPWSFAPERYPRNEKRVLDRIYHHLCCDEVHFTTLYDLVSLMDVHDAVEAGYARVLLECAARMRTERS